MAYFGGATTERSVPRIDARKIVALFFLILLAGSLGYLATHPELIKLATPERVVIREVPVVAATQEVFVARETLWPGQKLSPEMFTKQIRSLHGMESKVVLDTREIDGSYANTVIPTDTPILHEFLTAVPPKNALTARIPPGYRAVTIGVDAESGVEGWARPGVKVDVVWTTNQRNRQIVSTILENVQIISAERSVNSGTDEDGNMRSNNSKQSSVPSHVTLLVQTKDAPKIQLAKSSGTLSLNLRGDSDSQEVGNTVVTVDKILKGQKMDFSDEGQGRVIIGGKEFVVQGRELVPVTPE